MANKYDYPGVYIEELPANGPIAGVGTSTPAFLGAALQGPLLTPTKVTNWTQFRNLFGDYMVGFYLAYAVKGFFDNGGAVAYIVRVGTGQRAFLNLLDRGQGAAQGTALRVLAKREGNAGNNITVEVDEASLVPIANGAAVHHDSATISSATDNKITLTTPDDVKKFRPGDTVTIDGTTERAVIDRISGADLVLQTKLSAPHQAGTVRIADLVQNQTQFRVDNSTGLESGSVIEIAQGTTKEHIVITAVSGDLITFASPGLQNSFKLPVAQTDPLVTVVSLEFTLKITSSPATSEVFPNLSMNPRHSRYWGSVVKSSCVDLLPPFIPSVQPPPDNRPAALAANPLQNGVDDEPGKTELYGEALDALVPIMDVQLVCVPDRTDKTVQQQVVTHCEQQMDRFAILDAATGSLDLSPGSPLLAQRGWCESKYGYASLYYPWISITDLLSIPPSGHIAGIFARVDAQRGVHKAPANELINGAIGLATIVDNRGQGQLNLAGINVLRVFPGAVRPVVWGARTTAPPFDQTAWIHNSVRRLFIFVETSLQTGLRQWVFEPNDTGLWKKLERTITEFLTRVWRSGALFGSKASEAFYVKIDEELNPPSVRALGQVIIEIGMAPVHPAEFVVVRIGMWEGGASIIET